MGNRPSPPHEHWLIVLIAMAFLIGYQGYSQKQGAIWYFGQNAGLDFRSYDPMPISGGQTNSTGGVASICDSTGQLIFYTDGQSIWNSNHNRINSSNLSGDPISTQAATIVPNPAIVGQYFVFTTRSFITGGQNNWVGNYYIIQISPGGSGQIIYDYSTSTGKPGLLENATEKFAAISFTYGDNNIGYWFLMHEFNSNRFIKVKLDSIWHEPIFQSIGSIHQNDTIDDGTNRGAKGQMKANDQGNLLALAVQGGKYFELFSFNIVTGILSNPRLLPAGDQTDKFAFKHGAYGVEFSPTGAFAFESNIGNFLYGSTSDGAFVYQWDLADTDILQMIKDGRILFNNPGFEGGALQRAPNGNIYAAFKGQKFLGVIHSPMHPAPFCDFQEHGASLSNLDYGIDGTCELGLPATIPIKLAIEPFDFENLCFGDETLIYLTNQTNIAQSSIAFIIAKVGGSVPQIVLRPPIGQYEVRYRFPSPGIYRITLNLIRMGAVLHYTRELTINPQPLVQLSPRDTVPLCTGASMLLDAGPGAFYQWEDARITTRTRVITLDDLHPMVEYRVKVTDYHGCIGWDTLWVERKNGTAIASITSSTASCGMNNGSATVIPTGNIQDYDYIWEGYPNEKTNTLTGIGGGDYTVQVISKSNECSSLVTIHVGELAKPDVRITATKISIFPGQPTRLTAHGAMRYEWINPIGLTTEAITVNPWSETIFTVLGINTGSNGSLCMDTAGITIRMKPNGPEWSFQSSDFLYNQMVISTVHINSEPLDLGYGKIGAFQGEKCCGLMVGAEAGADGIYVFNLQVFSSEPDGLEISFRYWDPETDSVYDIFERVSFKAGGMIGSRSSPFVMNGLDQKNASCLMSPGWNWFSLNIQQYDMNIKEVFNTLNKREGDMVKNQFSSATYYPDYGWFGDLTEVSPNQTYKIHLGAPGYLNYQGYPSIAFSDRIAIRSGWNWIGYLPSNPLNINQALESMAPEEGDYFESRTQSAMFYNGFGWFGGLTTLEPLTGYMLKTDHDATLIYPKGGSPLKVQASYDTKYPQESANPYFNPHAFKFTGNISIAVLKDGQNMGDSENEMIALINGVPRGIAKGMLFPPTNSMVYNLMVYSNVESGEKVQFKFYDRKNDRWLAYSETVDFSSDMILGDALHPLILENYVTDISSFEETSPRLEIYPNPSCGRFIVTYNDWKQDKDKVILYNVYGRVLQDLTIRFAQSGGRSIQLDVTGIAPGIYFIIITGSRSEKYPIIIR